MKSHLCYRRRQGFTLVEFMVVIVASSALAAIATALLVTALRANHNVVKSRDQKRGLAQLELAVRSDLRHAARAEIVADPFSGAGSLRLVSATGDIIEYRQSAAGMDRSQSDGEGKPLGQERFFLRLPLTAVWKLEGTTPQVVTLQFAHSAGQPPTTAFWQAYRLRGSIGREQRLLTLAQEREGKR